MPWLFRPFLFCILFLFFLTSCLFGGGKSFRGVKSYHSGRVLLADHRFYRVGELSSAWYEIETGAKAIAFYHDTYRSTIFTDAFCDDTFDDIAHEKLIANMVGGLQELHRLDEKNFELDGRTALQKRFQGALDGAKMNISIVVVKKENCLFDFVMVTPPKAEEHLFKDFEHFYQGFAFTP